MSFWHPLSVYFGGLEFGEVFKLRRVGNKTLALHIHIE